MSSQELKTRILSEFPNNSGYFLKGEDGEFGIFRTYRNQDNCYCGLTVSGPRDLIRLLLYQGVNPRHLGNIDEILGGK